MCEFCWALRRFFQCLGIPYRSVDLDSVELQRDDFGGDLRAVLLQKTGEPTIPQVFVGGTHVGGCTSTFEAYRSGTLASLLERPGVSYGRQPIDTAPLLPKWLHPRQPEIEGKDHVHHW